MLCRVWDVTLTVSDLERAVDFYERILGLSKKYYYPDNYAGLDCGGVEIGLVPGVSIGQQEGVPCIDFLVQDIDQLWRILSEQGVRFLKEPHETPWGGTVAEFIDPDGNKLQLVQINWQKYFSISAKS